MLSPSMFRAAISKLSLRKKLMILVLVGVFLPVLVLTYMQYRSLAELENKTKGAFKDNLRQGLTILQRQLKQRLENVATQTLNPIGSIRLPTSGSAEEIEKHFADVKRSHPEIGEIFALAYSDGQAEAYFYSDKFVKIARAEFTSAQSHIVSVFDKSLTAQSFLDDDRKYLFTQDSCPACPPSMREATYLFYPLQDQTKGQQRSFAGVLLNESFVRDDVIARSINALVAAHSPEVAITITDNNQRVLYANAGVQDEYLCESNFDRPFSNWRGGINLKNTEL